MEIDSSVDYWLNQWALWYRSEPNRLGYPNRVLGLVGGGESRRGEEWQEDETLKIWARNCQAMDALVESLPPMQCCAMRHTYLGEPWRFPMCSEQALLEAGAAALLIGMNARAVL